MNENNELDNIFDEWLATEQMDPYEKCYQEYCNRFSRSYLQGSSFYVGPSLVGANKPLPEGLISYLNKNVCDKMKTVVNNGNNINTNDISAYNFILYMFSYYLKYMRLS